MIVVDIETIMNNVLQISMSSSPSLDQELCLAHLVRFFSAAVPCLISHSSSLTHTTATALQVRPLTFDLHHLPLPPDSAD